MSPFGNALAFETSVSSNAPRSQTPFGNVILFQNSVLEFSTILNKLTPDSELINRARSGDERAFTKLVHTYEPVVYNFSFKVCRDREKAVETVQDTFVNVYRKLKQFNRKSKFTTWLYSIVVNNCLMKRRKTKIEANLTGFENLSGSDVVPPWKETPLDMVMNKELKHRLDEAILKLPMKYRIVFILRDVEGNSAEETAKILKLSVPAVKSRLRRARMFLRQQLNDYMAA